jgi:hypothetical protein
MPTQDEINALNNINSFSRYFKPSPDKSLLSQRPFTHELAKRLPKNPLENTIGSQFNRLTAEKGCSILEFATMQKELLAKAWGDDWGIFTLDFNTGKTLSETDLPVITFNIFNRIPSANKLGLKPRVYLIGYDDTDPEYLIIQHTQWQDAIVEYNILHNTMNGAFELMERFETFNALYAGYFKQNGLMEFIFRQEVPTSSTLKIDSTIPSRCLYYDMVIQNIFTQRIRATEEILAVAGVAEIRQP